MNFDSAVFVSWALPVLVLLYVLIRNNKARNVLLLVAGLALYSFGSFSGLLLLLLAVLINYGFGLLLMRSEKGKAPAVCAVVFDLAFLAAFKYLDFLMSGICGLAGIDWAGSPLTAPLGISFFTFKCVSYIIDTYRDRGSGTKSLWRFLLYVSFFPQITAGPITRFRDFDPQLDGRSFDRGSVAHGLRRFILGLGKKLLIAGAAAEIADAVFALGKTELSASLAWLGALAYMLQIYFDFSGYSDMAIGLGGMFGFDTPENFNYPYVSASITEFWRRWHISLSSWFRDYLYIPLGGNRKGKTRAALNKFVVFTLCGLWHGASLTYILWGVWHGLLSALESLRVIDTKKLSNTTAGKTLCHVYTLLAVCLGFVMFRAESVSGGFAVLGAMFGAGEASVAGSVLLHRLLTADRVFFLVLGAVVSCPVVKRVKTALVSRGTAEGTLDTASYVFAAAVLLLCLTLLASGGFSPFIYAGF